MKTKLDKIRGALFAEVEKHGIDTKDEGYMHFRNNIAPEIIGKRISKANAYELGKLLDYVHKWAGVKKEAKAEFTGTPQTMDEYYRKKYPPNRKGLLEEISDLLSIRFRDNYTGRLNFTSRFGAKDGFRLMKINGLKALKSRLKELNRSDPWEKE